MSVKEIENSFAICGLVCALCSSKEICSGCKNKCEACNSECSIKKCCIEKGLDYCFLCDEFPCDEGMFKNTRVRAFNIVAKDEGINKLSQYLHRNKENGIQYHRSGGIQGDYDRLKSEEEVISLLKNGKQDPFEVCPTYESRSFHVRLISDEDAEDLYKCYSNHEAQRFFNNDGCWGGEDFFAGFTLEKMKNLILWWLNNEYKKKVYVRFSIIDRLLNKAIGTLEVFPRKEESKTKIILRIDILPEYENLNFLVRY